MNATRRRFATLLLAACPAVLAGCTGAEVQDFFASQGHPVSADFAEKIAKIGSMLEARAGGDGQAAHEDPANHEEHHEACAPTAAPTTSAVVKASLEHHGDCGAPEQKQSGRRR